MAQFLIVEEDRRRFEQMKQCLLAKGHKAWQAATPAEAFDFLDQYSVDVIISAVHLEKGDVSEFLRQVKENDRLEQIPFIFCCTQEEECGQAASSETVQAGKVLGARKYILLQQFDAAKFWEQLEDCLPQNAQKNDSLGGQVKTYSIHDVSWSRQNR